MNHYPRNQQVEYELNRVLNCWLSGKKSESDVPVDYTVDNPIITVGEGRKKLVVMSDDTFRIIEAALVGRAG